MAGIRVLVVDDSAVIRARLCDALEQADGIEIAGTASNGRRALEVYENLRPDVVTMDIQMPDMDGLTALDALLGQRPVPVIMVSSLTQAGASVTLEALERGAIDYVGKPESGATIHSVFGEELIRKIRAAAGVDVARILRIRQERKIRRAERQAERQAERLAERLAEPRPERPVERPGRAVIKAALDVGAAELADKCVAIGISTGGPPALAALFETLRPPMPPIVVVQHMPPHFTRPLSWRLDALSALSIKEAVAGDTLEPNHVYIAPGGHHLALRRIGDKVKVVIRDDAPVSGHKPSIDVMMQSAAPIFGASCLGIIMTGMGHDGSDGCRAIRAAGGYVLGQDEATSDVYGMNKVALLEGNVDKQFALSDAATAITRVVKGMCCRAALVR